MKKDIRKRKKGCFFSFKSGMVKVFTIKVGDTLFFNNRETGGFGVHGSVIVTELKDEGKTVLLKLNHGEIRLNKKDKVQKSW